MAREPVDVVPLQHVTDPVTDPVEDEVAGSHTDAFRVRDDSTEPFGIVDGGPDRKPHVHRLKITAGCQC